MKIIFSIASIFSILSFSAILANSGTLRSSIASRVMTASRTFVTHKNVKQQYGIYKPAASFEMLSRLLEQKDIRSSFLKAFDASVSESEKSLRDLPHHIIPYHKHQFPILIKSENKLFDINVHTENKEIGALYAAFVRRCLYNDNKVYGACDTIHGIGISICPYGATTPNNMNHSLLLRRYSGGLKYKHWHINTLTPSTFNSETEQWRALLSNPGDLSPSYVKYMTSDPMRNAFEICRQGT